MFTKRHYGAIAEIIAKQKDLNPQDGTYVSEAMDFVLFQIVAGLENYFEQDDPNFNWIEFRVKSGHMAGSNPAYGFSSDSAA